MQKKGLRKRFARTVYFMVVTPYIAISSDANIGPCKMLIVLQLIANGKKFPKWCYNKYKLSSRAAVG